MITIYTDGGCEPNPGQGAWAWAIDKDVYDSGGEDHTTNNRMELMAILKAMEWVRSNQGIQDVVTIHSDSKYCVNGFMYWMHSWKASGWKKKGGEIKNLDLWKEMYENRNNFILKWVKGHAGNEMNEFVDGLCNKELGIEKKPLPIITFHGDKKAFEDPEFAQAFENLVRLAYNKFVK